MPQQNSRSAKKKTKLEMGFTQKIEATFKEFLHDVSKEKEETKEAASILKKHMRGQTTTKEERRMLKMQCYDLLKAVGIGIPLILIPGGSIIIPVLLRIAKKYKINILPSSFDKRD